MNIQYLIDYVTRFKPQHDIWRYTLAELGFGGVATTIGLKSAFRMKRVALKALGKPKLGPPQFVAALTILDAVYEFSHIPGDVAPPMLAYTPALEQPFTSWLFHRSPVHYWVSLIFALGELRCHFNDDSQQARTIDNIISSLVSQIEFTIEPRLPARNDEVQDADLDMVEQVLNMPAMVTCPSTLAPGAQSDLYKWSVDHVRDQRILPIAMRWLGVAISPSWPKLGLRLTGANIILPDLINMDADDFITIAQKIGGKAFDAIVAFIGELLHWRIIREGGDQAFYEELAEIRPFDLAWSEPGAVDAHIA